MARFLLCSRAGEHAVLDLVFTALVLLAFAGLFAWVIACERL